MRGCSVGLSTGHRLPLLGYGTSVFQGREREGSMRLQDALLLALQSGCRLIDCSPEYTQQRTPSAHTPPWVT